MAEYFYLESDNQIGPVSKAELQVLLEEGAITPQTPVFRTGDSEWRTAHLYPELAIQRTQSARSSAGDSSIPEAWLRHSAHRPAKDRGSSIQVAGMIIAVIGVIIAVYFFFIYDTSVSTESHYIQGYGSVGGQRVHNQGLMQNRLLGCIGGMVVASIGSVMVISGRRSS